MTDQIVDLFSIPALIIIIGIFVLLLSFLIVFITHNSSNNEMNVQCIRMADAMNAFISNNAGFSDNGSGSFAQYVAEYAQERPPHNPILVVVKAWDSTDTTTAFRSSAFWVASSDTPDASTINTYSYIHGRLCTAYTPVGGSSSVINAGNTGVMQENWAYRIELYPLYKALTEPKASDTISSIAMNTGTAPVFIGALNHNTYYQLNTAGTTGTANWASSMYTIGSPIILEGQITNYIKNAKS